MSAAESEDGTRIPFSRAGSGPAGDPGRRRALLPQAQPGYWFRPTRPLSRSPTDAATAWRRATVTRRSTLR